MTNYVDTITKTCYFGYGYIAIESCMNFIIFREINHPGTVGEYIVKDGVKIGNWEYTGNKIILHFATLEDVRQFSNLLEVVEENNGGVFEFKNIIFDFTNYNKEDIRLFMNYNKISINSLLLFMAC